MDYQGQRRYFARYQTVWLMAASALLLVASILLRDFTPQAACLLGAMVAVSASLGYLPNYLHLHHEPYKRAAWAVRARWILITGIVVVAGLFRLHDPRWLLILGIGGSWLLFANLAVKILYRPGRLSEDTMAVVYFVTDLWLAVSVALAGGHWLIVAGILVLAAHFAVLVYPERGRFWFPMLAMASGLFLLRNANPYDSGGFEAGYLIVGVALVTAVTSASVFMARSQAGLNHSQALAALSGFTGEEAGATERRLLNSRGTLAENWKKAVLKPDDSEALAKWYADNSLPYLFDIMRFHLTYKHIRFTLDVLELARGRCLDYGAGNGDLALALAANGCPTVYFDVPGESRRFAEANAKRRELALDFVSTREDIKRAAGEAGFDTILSLDVLEHLPDLGGQLDFLISVLAPGGRIILTVPEGATATHPMHLTHKVNAGDYLKGKGLRDAKSPGLRLTASEILRKGDCLIYERPR